MIGSRRFVVAILGFSLSAGGAAAEPITASRGLWAGPPTGAGKIELRVEGNENRFAVDLTGGGGSLVAGEFQAGRRKDVFEPPAPGGMMSSLMSFFGRGGATSPIEGKPLAWARRVGEELIVYRLDVGNGAYRLDRLVLTPAGNRLELAFERREHDRPPERFSATLERRP